MTLQTPGLASPDGAAAAPVGLQDAERIQRIFKVQSSREVCNVYDIARITSSRSCRARDLFILLTARAGTIQYQYLHTTISSYSILTRTGFGKSLVLRMLSDVRCVLRPLGPEFVDITGV